MIAELTLFAVTQILTFKRNRCVGQASGFFYQDDDDRVFLVTNRHVVSPSRRSEDPTLPRPEVPDSLNFHVRTNSIDLRKVKYIGLDLWKVNGNNRIRLWKRPAWNLIDLALIEIPSEQLAGCQLNAFSEKDIYREPLRSRPGIGIPLGLEALVLGYPLGFFDWTNHLPTARRATVATVPRLNFEGKPRFLVDANLHKGMSGSPVISSPPARSMGQSPGGSSPATDDEVFLLGVYSSEWKIGCDSLGLHNVWHPTLIKKTILGQ
jgi:hypothetical protein